SVNLTAQGTISGTGTLTKIGTATNILTAIDNTWGGSTTISAGTLQIGSGGADGSFPDLPITDNGVLLINSANSFVLTSPITGSGSMNQTGSGTVVLSGSNSFAGQFSILGSS